MRMMGGKGGVEDGVDSCRRQGTRGPESWRACTSPWSSVCLWSRSVSVLSDAFHTFTAVGRADRPVREPAGPGRREPVQTFGRV